MGSATGIRPHTSVIIASSDESPLWSTNPLERVNGEIKHRADVAGIFPSEAAILRLGEAVLMETHDEWQITERRYLSEGSMASILAAGEPAGLASPPPALLAS